MLRNLLIKHSTSTTLSYELEILSDSNISILHYITSLQHETNSERLEEKMLIL